MINWVEGRGSMNMTMERVADRSGITKQTSVHKNIARKEIWMADLSGSVGSEQNGCRPVIITQCRNGNLNSPTTQVVPCTSSESKAKLPVHVQLSAEGTNLLYNSVALIEQQRVIDKKRLLFKIGEVDEFTMKQIGKAIMISNELIEFMYS